MAARPKWCLTRMRVKDGRIVLPDGMSYRVLVLPQVETMTPPLLTQDQGTGRGGGHGCSLPHARSKRPD